MKTNSATTTLRKNQSSGHQPVFAPSQIEIGHGARQPPRNSVAASAETVTMFTYSPRKNIANFSDEYSVWKPPTSSLSASGRSNGARVGSPTDEIAYTTKLGSSVTTYQVCSCPATISLVESEPATRMTGTID